jgi:galactokinase/galacturonokinase
VRLCSLDYPGEAHFALDNVPDKQPGDWGNFARGAVRALEKDHTLRTGIYGVTSGRFSAGGLSSSAAVSVALLLALEDANGTKVSKKDNILLGQAIENEYLGLRSGILDQSAILLSERNHLTIIDCESVQHELIPSHPAMPPYSILIAFSGLKKALVGTDYNRRVAECAAAATVLLNAVGRDTAGPVLRRVSAGEYDAHKHRLRGAPARRAAHFFSEADRVEKGAEAWRRGDLTTVGHLMTASGESSIHNYQCGSPPLVDLYEILIETDGIYGARFSGAGFRGCCVALVEEEAASEAAERVRRAYTERYPDLADDAITILCQSDDGARIL